MVKMTIKISGWKKVGWGGSGMGDEEGRDDRTSPNFKTWTGLHL